VTSQVGEPTLAIRPYQDRDEAAVLELLRAALGEGPTGRRSAEFFRWKHFANPFGSSVMLVAEADGRIVGLRAFMRWRFVTSERELAAVRAVDTATHPGYQRMGIFSRLTRAALEVLRDEADLVFNTPNDKSLPGYLKLGWRLVGKVPISVRVRRPLHFAWRLRHLKEDGVVAPSPSHGVGESVLDVLDDEEQVTRLISELDAPIDRLVTPRDLHYLRWRYGAAPQLGYRAVSVHSGGRLDGLAIFRLRPRGGLQEATVSEVLVPGGDAGTARRLLRLIARTVSVDHITAHFTPGSSAAQAAILAGFVRSPVGMAFVTNVLKTGLHPDPTQLGSWSLSLGDLEVF
jgi:GNAT superfamily N-acetyltransferase